MDFFDDLAANATANGVQIITYVGNDDGISPHFGTEGQSSSSCKYVLSHQMS